MLKKLYEKSEIWFAVACILTHSIFNGLSAFSNQAAMTPQREILSGILLAVIGGGYAWYLALAVKEDQSFAGEISMRLTR